MLEICLNFPDVGGFFQPPELSPTLASAQDQARANLRHVHFGHQQQLLHCTSLLLYDTVFVNAVICVIPKSYAISG